MCPLGRPKKLVENPRIDLASILKGYNMLHIVIMMMTMMVIVMMTMRMTTTIIVIKISDGFSTVAL